MVTFEGDFVLKGRRSKPIQYIVNEKGCWLCVSHKPNNVTKYIQLLRDLKTVYLHRYSYQFHVGPIPEGKLILHSCDERSCFNPEHLRPGTDQENMEDRNRKGRQAKGERQGHAKLKNADIPKIFHDKRTHVEIAKDYGVSRATIGHIKLRRSWKCVEVS